MINYLQSISMELISVIESRVQSKSGLSMFDYFRIVAEELDKLETRNFPPDKRYDFVVIRQHFRKLAETSSITGDRHNSICNLSKSLNDLLKTYGNYDSGKLRSFNFLHDQGLKEIVERDYMELSSILLPDGAWKSTVIMAGSILEAVLYDVLVNPKYYSIAHGCAKAPKHKGVVKDLISGEWKLVELISVAEDISLLPAQRSSSIDQVLRDYRNFVHPKKEIKSQHSCTEAEDSWQKGH